MKTQLMKRIALTWGVLVLLAFPLVGPLTGSAAAAWESPADEDPHYFWGGENGPNDQTTDPDEPFDGLDRIVNPEKSVKVVQVVKVASAPSFLERFVRLMQSLWMLKG